MLNSYSIKRAFWTRLLSQAPPLLIAVSSWAAEPQAPRIEPQRLQSAIKHLDDLAGKTLENTGVPGIAIAIVHGDDILFKKGYGVREAGNPQPIDADTVFQVASVSKPITATVLAALVGQGRIKWDDRVIDHDPGFRMYDPYVTRELRLRDLLCHRSGLPDHAGDLLEDIGYEQDEVLRRLRFQPPDSSFRAQYAYTNFGYSEAAYAAAGALSESWPELADEEFFKPLGMTSTSYRFADYAKATNRALLHVPDGDKSVKKWIAKFTRHPDAQAPAGGVSTTLNDLVRWMQLLVGDGKYDGRQVVDAAALADTHTPQIVWSISREEGRVVGYGLGWIVSVERGGRVFWKHSGEFELGVRSEVAVLPPENLAIVVLSNAAPTGIPEGLVESFYDWALDGKLSRDWVEFANRMFDEQVKAELAKQGDYSRPPARPSPPLELAAYTGKYENKYFGPIQLTERAGKLVLHLGPKPLEFELRHWDRDTFLYQPTGENATGLSAVRFSVATAGQADHVLLENLNIHGLGTFTRAK
jgi:CubicO group peptidase (beta-lactamase class C family)